MREAMIVCPRLGNDGACLADAIDWVRDAMVNAFGGARVNHACGYWRDGDTAVQEEPCAEITSAFAPTPEHERALLVIARTFGISAKQKCVFVRFPDGNVRIIETSHLWERKAARVSTPGGEAAFVA